MNVLMMMMFDTIPIRDNIIQTTEQESFTMRYCSIVMSPVINADVFTILDIDTECAACFQVKVVSTFYFLVFVKYSFDRHIV